MIVVFFRKMFNIRPTTTTMDQLPEHKDIPKTILQNAGQYSISMGRKVHYIDIAHIACQIWV